MHHYIIQKTNQFYIDIQPKLKNMYIYMYLYIYISYVYIYTYHMYIYIGIYILYTYYIHTIFVHPWLTFPLQKITKTCRDLAWSPSGPTNIIKGIKKLVDIKILNQKPFGPLAFGAVFFGGGGERSRFFWSWRRYTYKYIQPLLTQSQFLTSAFTYHIR